MWEMANFLRLAARAGAFLLVLAVFCAASVVAPAGASTDLRPATAEVAGPDASYRLATGDKVHVNVYGEDDLGGDFDVDGNGYVRLPLIGQVQASGLSTHELEDRIASLLKDGYLQEPRVSVAVVQYRPFYIIGEVNKPGQYPYVNDMNALNAVALAGGYTEKAENGFIYLRRSGEAQEERLPADQSTLIKPGDVVRVPPSFFWSFVNVASPLAAIASPLWFVPSL
jgi:protein involved in polysaccharide export with SLBB domain